MSTILCNTQFLLFYIINSLICSSFTVYYEKKRSAEFGINLMSPKCVSAITPLSFMTSLMVLKPHLKLLNKVCLINIHIASTSIFFSSCHLWYV